jgi:ACT domain-containing protein
MEHETRISKLEQARTEIEDALLVMAHLEKRQSEQIRILAENDDAQSKRLKELSERDEAHRLMNEQTDARIAQLVSAIGELIARMPPPR